MNYCKSCSAELIPEEQLKTLPDGSTYVDDFCPYCVDMYVTNIDNLDSEEYAHEQLTKRRNGGFYINRE